MTGPRPRVALITDNFPPTGGGVSRYYGELARAYGPSMEIVSPFTGSGMPQGRGIRVRIDQARFVDTVDARGAFPLVGHPHLALPFALRRKRFGLVMHGGEWSRLGRVGTRMADFLASRADLVIVNSEATARRWLPRASSRTLVEVVHPAVPESWVREGKSDVKTCPRQDALRVLCVSRLVRRKQVPELADAVAQLHEVCSRRVHLTIVGNGPELPEVKKIASRASEAIEVRGQVTDNELKRLYASSDVFALCPADLNTDEGFEGYGIVYLEAAAFGLPVVATRAGGIPEALHPNGSVLLEPDRWREDIAETLMALQSERATLLRMAHNNLSWAAANTWEDRACKLASILGRVHAA